MVSLGFVYDTTVDLADIYADADVKHERQPEVDNTVGVQSGNRCRKRSRPASLPRTRRQFLADRRSFGLWRLLRDIDDAGQI
jgi:hypothetical protein